MNTVLLLLLSFCHFCCFSISAESRNFLRPTFSYSDADLERLQHLDSNQIMTKEELQKLDEITFQAVKSEDIDFYNRLRFFTYLYVAQADAAYLSFKSQGSFKGSLAPITKKIVEFFFKTPLPSTTLVDPFSQTLAEIVFEKIQQRINEEDSLSNEFKVPENKKEMFSAGLTVAKWIPWFAKPSTAFWPAPPPDPNSPIWKEQITQIKQAQSPMTEKKKAIIYRWGGLTELWSDDWRLIANKYLFSHQVPFSTILQVRSVLMMTFYDGVAAYVTAKYHYLTIRPKVYDSSIDYIIEVPKHPSYPAGHAAEGSMASAVLSYFFPKESQHWKQMADEEATSRIWAGVHYPIDIQGGKETGGKVAHEVLKITSN